MNTFGHSYKGFTIIGYNPMDGTNEVAVYRNPVVHGTAIWSTRKGEKDWRRDLEQEAKDYIDHLPEIQLKELQTKYDQVEQLLRIMVAAAKAETPFFEVEGVPYWKPQAIGLVEAYLYVCDAVKGA